jgi:hypothetical protein
MSSAIARNRPLGLATSKFDGTLLYQLYLVLHFANFEDTIFCDIPVARVTQSLRKIDTAFGTADKESKFTQGKISQENSIRFTEGFFEISHHFDNANNTDITPLILRDF